MSVYKEAMHILSELDSKQTRIFDDACDYGIPIKDENDPVFDLVKQLKDSYFHPKTDKRTVEKFSVGITVTLTIMMIDEFGDGSKFPVTITYTRQPMKTLKFGELIGILEIDGGRFTS